MTNIKITELSNIGGNIAANSLVPVVDMSGTPTTKKANLQVVGNLMLSGAGGANFPPASRAVLAQTITNSAQPNITSVGTLTGLAVAGNITASNITAGNISGNIVVAVANLKVSGGTSGYVLQTDGAGNLSWTAQTGGGGGSYSNANVASYLPTFTGTVGANRISSNAASGNNLQINANGSIFTFTQDGKLYWPASAGNTWVIESTSNNEFQIKSTSNVRICTESGNGNSHFNFNIDGVFSAPGNVNLEGTRLNVGPGAANVPIATNPTLVVTDSGLEFIQAALINENANGSSDYAAYGAGSDETQGFADLGFAGHSFNDPNYSITPPGDGYVFVQGYANGLGGALTLATGQNGDNPDIIFATGGFISGAEFGRIDHADNVLYLSRSGSGIKFSDGSIQTTAGLQGTGDITFNGPNISTDIADGNINVIGSTSGNILLSSNNHIFLHVDDSIDPHGGVEMTWARTSNGVTQTAGISINSDFGNNEVATGNVQIVACGNLAEGLANSSWTFGTDGKLAWPGIGAKYLGNSAAGEFEIHSDANVVIGTDIGNSDRLFVFDQGGDFYAPGNVTIDGTQVFVGTGANTLTSLSGSTLVISSNSNAYVQSVINNVSDIGSADWVAQGRLGGDEGGYVDLGFNSSGFNDPEYSSMGPGDGYLYTEGYAEGQAPAPTGGNLVIGTGSQGLTRDVIFTTGGHTANDIIARFSDANNAFELSRANAVMKFPDGSTQSTAYTGGAGSELINGNNSFVLDSAGNVVFEGTPSGNAVDRGLVWDYGANANGVNSMIRQDLNGLTVRAWTESGGGANGFSAPVNIITNQDAATKTWTFDGQGNVTVPSGSINSINDGGDLGAYLTLNPEFGIARLAGRTLESTVNYTSANWTSATYTGTQINIVDAPQLVVFFTENQFNVGVNQTISINGDEPVLFTGYTIGTGNDVIVYTNIAADPDPTTVTSIDFYYQLESYVAVDYDAGALNINATGLTINLDNDQTSGPDINLRSGDDITLQGKDKSLGSESEGGDINIYGGDGGDDDGLGNNSATGGDIQIVGGIGGSGNSSSGSQGGFARFQGGDGGDAGVSSVAGQGGFVQINAGDAGYNGGNAQLGAQGGYVDIYAGQTTLANGVGGNVSIRSGTAADGNGVAGNVQIITPISATANGGTWTFDGRGNLTLPTGTPHIKTSDESSTVTISVSGTANQRSQFVMGNAGNTDQYTYISSQNDANGIASFGLNAPNGVPTSAVIGINNGTVLDWTFSSAPLDSTEAYLYTPAGATITTPNAPSGENGKNIFIEAGSVDQENFNTNTGGELMLKGGRGGFNNGSGGGPGGNVNINAGESADPAGRAGNVYVTAGALKNWIFDYTGNLTLAGGSSMIQSIANSSLDPINPSVSTMTLTPDSNYTSQALVLDPTAPGHIHLRAFASSNIDEPSANIFLGGEDTSFEITSGSNNQAVIHSGGNDWTFGNDGILTVPGNLVAVSASPAPSISGFSSVSALQFTNGNSNVTINANSNLWNFDSTGNLIIPGTSGGVIKTVANGAIAIAAIDGGSNNPAQVISFNANGAPTTALSAYASEATIQANINGSIQTWAFTNAGVVTSPVLTYANLSAATTAGRRAFISDANLAAAGNFGNAVSGGGANTVPVYSDGAVWRIG